MNKTFILSVDRFLTSMYITSYFRFSKNCTLKMNQNVQGTSGPSLNLGHKWSKYRIIKFRLDQTYLLFQINAQNIATTIELTFTHLIYIDST